MSQKKVVAGAAALLAAGTLVAYSPQLQEHLGRWEGDGQNTVYADRLAGGLPTVCKGITRYSSPYPVIVGDYWSEAQCEAVERMVVERSQIKLADCIHVTIRQHVFDALSGFAHNVGVPNVCASRAVGLINQGSIVAGCKAIAQAPDGRPVWSSVRDGVNPDGSPRYKFVPGLYNRRMAESEMCLTGQPVDNP